MPTSIKYDARLLATVALAVSTGETRYYLKGVMIEGRKAVATNGHLMTVATDDGELTENNPSDAAIMPVSKKAITAMKNRKAEYVEFKDGTLTVWSGQNDNLYMEPSHAIDGTFPDWESVLPKTGSEVSHGAFESDLLLTVAHGAKILGYGSGVVSVSFHGEDDSSPHLAKYHNIRCDIFTVLMPLLKRPS